MIRTRMRTRRVLAVALTFVLPLAAPLAAAEPALRAGASRAEITPPLGELVVGGFAPFPATSIHDALHARAIVLDDGRVRIGIVICDSLGIPREVYEQARQQIAQQTELKPDHLLMAATHTHSATTAASAKYQPTLIRGIVESVVQAEKNLQPARIGWGGVDEPSEVFNRRWHVSSPELARNPFGGVDKVRMNPPRGHAALLRPAGPVDPEISIVSVQSLDGSPIAVLANYSLHYVGGVEKGDVSADYFGVFAERLERRMAAERPTARGAAPFVAILSNGTSGDINNNNYRERGAGRAPYEKMAQVADLVARRVQETLPAIEHRTDPRLGAATSELTLKYRKPDADMEKYLETVRARGADAEPYHRYEKNYAERVQRLQEGPETVTVPLQAIRIGDLGVCAIGFEVFAEIGLELKSKSPFADTFTIELANDSRGYLPTPAQHELGGYETWMGTNRVEREASVKITSTLLDLLRELRQP